MNSFTLSFVTSAVILLLTMFSYLFVPVTKPLKHLSNWVNSTNDSNCIGYMSQKGKINTFKIHRQQADTPSERIKYYCIE